MLDDELTALLLLLDELALVAARAVLGITSEQSRMNSMNNCLICFIVLTPYLNLMIVINIHPYTYLCNIKRENSINMH